MPSQRSAYVNAVLSTPKNIDTIFVADMLFIPLLEVSLFRLEAVSFSFLDVPLPFARNSAIQFSPCPSSFQYLERQFSEFIQQWCYLALPELMWTTGTLLANRTTEPVRSLQE